MKTHLFSIHFLRFILPAVLLAGGLIGCGAKEDFDKMRDATLQMNKTTGEMNETMKQMNTGMTDQMKSMSGKMDKINVMADKMDQMMARMDTVTSRTVTVTERMGELQKTTNGVVLDARQIGSLQSRQQQLEKMQKAEGLKAKFMLAAIYFSSFEFQLWRLQGPNPEEELNRMYADAVTHILNDLNQFILDDYSKGTDSWPIALSGKSANEGKTLMGLAAALHWKNPQYRIIERENGRKTMTGYDLIESALIAAKTQPNAANQPEYVKNVQMFRTNAVYMMKLRYNALANVVMGQSGGIKEILYGDTNSMGGVFLRSILDRITGASATKWTLDIAKLSRDEIALNVELLQHLARTKKLLETIGEKPELNGQFKMVLKSGEVKYAEESAPSAEAASACDVSTLLYERTQAITVAQDMCGTKQQLAALLKNGLLQLQAAASQ